MRPLIEVYDTEHVRVWLRCEGCTAGLRLAPITLTAPRYGAEQSLGEECAVIEAAIRAQTDWHIAKDAVEMCARHNTLPEPQVLCPECATAQKKGE